jgi:hypothetical protein
LPEKLAIPGDTSSVISVVTICGITVSSRIF